MERRIGGAVAVGVKGSVTTRDRRLFGRAMMQMATLNGQPFPANIENLYVFDKPFVRDDVFAGKRIIVVSLPGAFTPV